MTGRLRRHGPGRARRGATLVDVAIAAGLLALVVGLAMQVVVSLSSSTQSALVRANARRQVLSARTLLAQDVGGARPCAASGLGPAFVEVNNTSAGGMGTGSAVWFSDVDDDGDPDLVAWRLRAGLLQRAVRLTSPADDPCAASTTSLGWMTMAPAARPRCTTPAFVAVAVTRTAAGAPSTTTTTAPPAPTTTVAATSGCTPPSGSFAGSCTATPAQCRFSALAVDVVLEPPGASRAHLQARYLLPGALR